MIAYHSIPKRVVAFLPEFINDLHQMEKFKKGGMICWVDFTKSGTLSNNDLNDTLDLVQSILGRLPAHSCAFIICPYLISDRVQNGLRGEVRTGACEITSKHLPSSHNVA